MKSWIIVAALISTTWLPVRAQQRETEAPLAVEMTQGEVRKLDLERGTVTLKHDTIKSLDMPAMTMVFKAKDSAMLDTLKPGDKVRFKASNEEGKFIVTVIQAVK
jgi:Cu(I)/Ag(I) efflux system periplasmic protein CusF